MQRFFNWMKRFWWVVAIGILVVGSGIGAIIWGTTGGSSEDLTSKEESVEKQPEPEPEPEPVRYYSPLTGIEVTENESRRPVTAIMIENLAGKNAARPQSGLYEAGIVYEAVAEAGITRFLALYQEARPEKVGPVRSVRMHFLEWATPYNATIVHAGGAADALEAIRRGRYRDLSESKTYMYRTKDRIAPHNLYTSFNLLDEFNASKGYTSSEFTGFSRKPESPSAEVPAGKIEISMSTAGYKVDYTYDVATNSYLRSVGGEAHLDAERGQIKPKVVVVINLKETTRTGTKWTNFVTTGSGDAYVFQDGEAVIGSWQRDRTTDGIRFFDKDGKEILLNAGGVWISGTTKKPAFS
jgi:hypothetical protein